MACNGTYPTIASLALTYDPLPLSQTPAEFTVSIVEGSGSVPTPRHDRMIKVEVRSAGVPIPPQSLLAIFSRKSTQNGSSSANVGQDEPSRDKAISAPRSEGEDALVFDIVVEPLLFGVVPMGSWYTGAVVVASIVIGVVAASVLFKLTSI